MTPVKFCLRLTRDNNFPLFRRKVRRFATKPRGYKQSYWFESVNAENIYLLYPTLFKSMYVRVRERTETQICRISRQL
jgi:hypothetical protein